MYCVIHDGKLFRITFSRSLAEHVVEYAGKGRVEKYDAVAGRQLRAKETSPTGLYAIVSSKNNRVLRIATSVEEADLLCDYESRKICEAWIQKK